MGPLARTLVAYASGVSEVSEVKTPVDRALTALGLGPEALYSSIGRIIPRALESEIVVERLQGWLDALQRNMYSGDLRIADTSRWDRSTWPKNARGFGVTEIDTRPARHPVYV